MGWRVVERRIGRAGNPKQQAARQREWDARYGENWAVGYVIDGEFVLQEQAIETVYQRSYEAHFDAHPEDLEELVATAKVLRNPHAAATGGVDLQVPVIHAILRKRGLSLNGTEVVDIGTFNGERSHALSVRLSPLHVRVLGSERETVESFWQARKCLAIWQDDDAPATRYGQRTS